ncbi:hypothetical protein MUK42_33501 [Musa troglodytarum]|nr:hypothetical protein MUK42_33501 [Musa troglodytarum]
MPSPTPSTPAARLSPPWTSSTRSSARVAPSTGSEAELVLWRCWRWECGSQVLGFCVLCGSF